MFCLKEVKGSLGIQNMTSSVPHINLLQQIEVAPSNVRPKQFTLRDDNEQHYHRQMRITESPVYINLSWKATKNSQVYNLGIFRLDLKKLLAAGYIRLEKEGYEDDVRVRFYRANNGMIYLQTKLGNPALAVTLAPN